MVQKTAVRVSKFAVIGAILALFNFLIYTFLARVIMNTNELLWLDSIIAYLLATFLAYLLHSKITWKERAITRRGIFMFFLWNGVTAILISPFFTWLFTLITPLYEFVFNISTAIHLPFDYNFIESTGVFCLTTCVTMILNYLFYDKLVFGTSKNITPQNNRGDKNHNLDIENHNLNFSEHNPKVSVIVPIYNTAKYLPACLDSILGQTYQNLEIILIDDGSTDNSSDIAEDYALKDSRITVVHQKNRGQSSARNLGLKFVTGEFISFVDADDEVQPTFIESLLTAFTDDTSLSVCGIHYKRLKNHSSENVYLSPLRSRKPNESQKAYILYLLATDGRMYSSVNKLYRTAYAKKLRFDESLNFAEDTKFVLNYLKKSKGEPAFVLKPLYIYNFGTETSTMHAVSTNWHNWQTSYQNLKSWLGPHPSLQEKFWLRTVHLRWRISYLKSKHRAKKSP